MTYDLLPAALALATKGLPVFPLIPRGKIPLITKSSGGNGCLDATTNSEQITKWWTAAPNANIGLATGHISGVSVFDIDPRHGGDKTLLSLVQKYGRLPNTLVARTGGGGLHLYFRHVVGLRNSAGHIGDGIDVRSDGGYVVAPPSIHDSGGLYRWNSEGGPDNFSVADMPLWLVTLAQPKDQTMRAELPESWRRLVADGVAEGKRNVTVAKLAGHLLRRYVDPYVALDLVWLWNNARCKPPLGKEEIFQTVNNIARRECEKRRAAP